MIALALLAVLASNPAGACALPSDAVSKTATAPLLHALQMAAQGREALRQGDLDLAKRCLQAAHGLAPESTLIQRDLAVLLSLLGDFAEAKRLLLAAMAGGDRDPEVHAMLAYVLAQLGERRAAIQEVEAARSWRADLLGVSLGDPESRHRSRDLIDQDAARGAVAALVLAGEEASRGERVEAMNLAELAFQLASDHGLDPIIGEISQLFLREMAEKGGPIQGSLGAQLFTEFVTNPGFASMTEDSVLSLPRATLGVDAHLKLALGRLRLSAEGAWMQQRVLQDRSRWAKVELGAYRLGLQAEYPLSRDPEGLVLGFELRFLDVYADGYRVEVGRLLEGGPVLSLRLTPRTRLRFGLLGSLYHQGQGAPEDPSSSQSRHRSGQRAVLALRFSKERMRVEWVGFFTHHDAKGAAFDLVGGGAGATVVARVTPRLSLHSGFWVAYGNYGAVGDTTYLGSAARRSELRTELVLGARFAVLDGLALRLEDRWLQTAARVGHGYMQNRVIGGLEWRW